MRLRDSEPVCSYRKVLQLGISLLAGAVLAACGGGASTEPDVKEPPSMAEPSNATALAAEPAAAGCCETVESTRRSLSSYCHAALDGNSDAQLAMADIFAGDAPGMTPQTAGAFTDLRSAYMWYTVAASQGNNAAFGRRSAIEGRLDAARVAEAKQWATRWKQASCPTWE